MTINIIHHGKQPSARAKALCDRYFKPGSRAMCSGCPLWMPCTAPLPDWSQAGIDAHMGAVNAAADAADAAIEWGMT